MRSFLVFAAQKSTGQLHHVVLAPKPSHRHAVLCRTQDDHGLGVAAFLHLELPQSGRRENHIYE
jgi:hypothetical protein